MSNDHSPLSSARLAAERAKELAFLRELTRILLATEADDDLGHLLASIANALPQAFYKPSSTVIRIVIPGHEAQSPGTPGSQRIRQALTVRNPDDGLIEASLQDNPDGIGFLEEEQHLLEVVAGDLQLALGRSMAQTQRRRMEALLLVASRINQMIAQLTSPQDLLTETCQHLVTVGGYHHAWIATLSAGGQITRWFSAAESDLPVMGTTPDCVAAALAQDAVVIHRPDDPECTACPLRDLLAHLDTMLTLTAPLRHGGSTYGALIASARHDTLISDHEQTIIGNIANDLAMALHRRDLYHQQQVAEQRFRHLFTHLIDGFALHEIIVDHQGRACDYRFLMVNPAFERLTGLSAERVVGRRVLEVLPQTEAAWIETYGRVALTGQSTAFASFSRELHSYFEVNAYCPQPGQFACVIEDISARKLAADQLMASQQQFRHFIEAAPEAIFIQTEHRFAYANQAAVELFGATNSSQLLGQAVLDRFLPDHHEQIRARIARLNHDREAVEAVDEIILRCDGRPVPVMVSAIPIDYAGHHGALVFMRDLSLRQRLEQMEKMEAIGQLAGGIAHDFNNQLAVITGYGQLLHQRLPDPQLQSFVSPILDAAQRAADLTRQLLAFARKGHFQSISVDLHQLITETITVLQRSVDKRIVFTTHLKAQPSTVLGDPSMLQNLLLNLALNARDALPEGGEIGFATAIRSLDTDYCAQVPYDLQPGPYLCLCVTDNGIGIPQAMLDHIFEPFFTTKEIGQGTGLGLASVYGTVKQHRGAINVYSEPGHGTTFRIYLPPEDSASAYESSDSTRSAVLAPAPLRLLVVDDEEMFRQLSVDLLSPLGYQVVTMADGPAAIAYYADHWRDIDLVVLDMIMPKMGGPETFTALAAINPAVKVLLASGYSLNGTAQGLLDQGVAGFIQKPFNQAEISHHLAQLLNTDE